MLGMDEQKLAYLAAMYEQNAEKLEMLRALVEVQRREREEARYCRRLWLVCGAGAYYAGAGALAWCLGAAGLAALAWAVVAVAVVLHIAAHMFASASRTSAPKKPAAAGEMNLTQLGTGKRPRR